MGSSFLNVMLIINAEETNFQRFRSCSSYLLSRRRCLKLLNVICVLSDAEEDDCENLGWKNGGKTYSTALFKRVSMHKEQCYWWYCWAKWKVVQRFATKRKRGTWIQSRGPMEDTRIGFVTSLSLQFRAGWRVVHWEVKHCPVIWTLM